MSKPAKKPPAEPRPNRKKDLRRFLFAALYIGPCHLNGVEAAERAGYTGTRNALAVRANELLADAAVQQEIARYAQAVETTSKEVLQTLVGHMRGDMGEFISFDDNREAHLDLWKAKEARRLKLVKKFKEKRVRLVAAAAREGQDELINETITYEVEMYDAQAAAVHVGKLLGMFNNAEPPDGSAPEGQMTDEQLLDFYLRHHIPPPMWIPGVLRQYQAGHIKRVASKVLTQATP